MLGHGNMTIAHFLTTQRIFSSCFEIKICPPVYITYNLYIYICMYLLLSYELKDRSVELGTLTYPVPSGASRSVSPQLFEHLRFDHIFLTNTFSPADF